MFEIENLTVQYGSSPPAVRDFSMKIGKGEIVSIVGESGSGKSTAVRSAMGLLPPSGRITAGDVRFHGQSLLAVRQTKWREIRGEKISMIFQDTGNTLNPIRRIGPVFVEYLQTHSDMSKQEAWNFALEMLEKMRLTNCKNVMRSYPFQLSGGMRQRVNIAMAMSFQPELLLADEPTSALDVTTQAQIVRQMMELRDQFGSGIVIVTHNIGLALYMADRIIVMQNGRIVESGTPEKIRTEANTPYTRKLIASVPELADGGETDESAGYRRVYV